MSTFAFLSKTPRSYFFFIFGAVRLQSIISLGEGFIPGTPNVSLRDKDAVLVAMCCQGTNESDTMRNGGYYSHLSFSSFPFAVFHFIDYSPSKVYKDNRSFPF